MNFDDVNKSGTDTHRKGWGTRAGCYMNSNVTKQVEPKPTASGGAPVLIIIFITFLTFGCTKFVTRAFVPDANLKDLEITSLDDTKVLTFNNWIFYFNMNSAYETSDKKKYNSYSYPIAIIAHEKPENSGNFVLQTDSINYDFLLQNKMETVFLSEEKTTKYNNPPYVKSSYNNHDLYFGDLYIPPEVDSLIVSFTLTLIDTVKIDTLSNNYSFKMYKFEDQYRIPKPIQIMMDK